MTDCDNMKGFDTESIIFISTKTSYKIHHKHIVLTLTILINYLNYLCVPAKETYLARRILSFR